MTKVKESIRTPRPARTRKPSKGQRVGYLRVSSLDQNEVRQLEGLALDKTFTDKASGKDAKRPELEAMQSFVREGDTVFCHSMDRLARNLDDLRRIVLGLTESFKFLQPQLDDVSFELLIRSEQPTAVVHETICEQVH